MLPIPNKPRRVVQVNHAVLEKAPKLRVIGRAGRRGQRRFGWGHRGGRAADEYAGGRAVSVAEHALAIMLAMAWHIPQADASTRAGMGEDEVHGNELRGKTLGIVGLGSIGREVVKARGRSRCGRRSRTIWVWS